jgi:hypothetical protein
LTMCLRPGLSISSLAWPSLLFWSGHPPVSHACTIPSGSHLPCLWSSCRDGYLWHWFSERCHLGQHNCLKRLHRCLHTWKMFHSSMWFPTHPAIKHSHNNGNIHGHERGCSAWFILTTLSDRGGMLQ